jgi:conjugative transfer signal peptidase TraF
MEVPVWIERALAGTVLGVITGGLVCAALDLRVNTTRSIPVGLYRMVDEPVGKGVYVIFCPPQSPLFAEARERGYIGAGFCPGGYGYMMKRVVAMGGDAVTSADEGVSVNGELLPASVPRRTDKAGRAMARYQFNDYILKESELLLMSDVSTTSFDGRYFGPVAVGQVRGVIRPILVF